MPFGYLFFAAGLLALAALGVYLLVTSAVLVRKKSSRRSWIMRAGVPLGCAGLPLLLILTPILVGTALSALRPHGWAFEEVFDAEPPAEVTGLDAHTDAGLDSRSVYLAFDSSAAAKAWLAPRAAQWKRVAHSDWVDSDAFQGGPPDWWKGASATYAPHACARPLHQEFESGGTLRDIAIIDCISDQRIYVVAQRID